MNKELIELIEEFLNFTGQWYDFEDFVKDKGYTVAELGFTED